MPLSPRASQASPPKRPPFRLWVSCWILLLVWLFVAFWLGVPIGHYLFLGYLYGFSRVQIEGLHFLSTPKAQPWIVSNGDKIATDTHGFDFIIGLACSMLLA